MKVTLFYRDGGNYKNVFNVEVDDSVIEKMIVDYEGVENLVDKECTSDTLIEIEDLGLTVYDIPNIAEYGYDDEIDHNLVSIVGLGEE